MWPCKQQRDLRWQMLCGICYLHHHRIIHRDIKPENYLAPRRWRKLFWQKIISSYADMMFTVDLIRLFAFIWTRLVMSLWPFCKLLNLVSRCTGSETRRADGSEASRLWACLYVQERPEVNAFLSNTKQKRDAIRAVSSAWICVATVQL